MEDWGALWLLGAQVLGELSAGSAAGPRAVYAPAQWLTYLCSVRSWLCFFVIMFLTFFCSYSAIQSIIRLAFSHRNGFSSPLS